MNCNNIPFGGTSRRNSDTSATSKGNTATSYKKVKENIGSLLLPTITLTFRCVSLDYHVKIVLTTISESTVALNIMILA